jgi:transposase
LERAEAIIDVQKKLSTLLGIALPPIDSDETPR